MNSFIDKKNRVYILLWPMMTVCLGLVYCKFLNYLSKYTDLSDIILLLLFMPLLGYEIYVSNKFKKITSLADKIFLFGRILFWSFLFIIWVLVDFHAIGYFSFSIVPILHIIFTAESYITFFFFSLWLLIYYFATVKSGGARLVSSLLVPALFSYFLFFHFYFLGGLGASSLEKISKQDAVDVFFSAKDFPENDFFEHEQWTKIVNKFPKSMCFDADSEALYINYASTYGNSSLRQQPNILRIDLATKKTIYYKGYYSMDIAVGEKSIYSTPWFSKKIYELNKEDLSVRNKMDIEFIMEPYAISDIYYDSYNKYLYLANDIVPYLIQYDLTGAKVKAKFKPKDFQHGGFWNIVTTEQGSKLYATAMGAKYSVLEIDPYNMELVKSNNLNTFGISAMTIDEANGFLYLQDGHSDKLYELRQEDLEINRILKGKVHARKILLDMKRKAIYLLDYFYGNLIHIDLQSGQQIKKIKVGAKPTDMLIYKDVLYINSRAGIISVDLTEFAGTVSE